MMTMPARPPATPEPSATCTDLRPTALPLLAVAARIPPTVIIMALASPWRSGERTLAKKRPLLLSRHTKAAKKDG